MNALHKRYARHARMSVLGVVAALFYFGGCLSASALTEVFQVHDLAPGHHTIMAVDDEGSLYLGKDYVLITPPSNLPTANYVWLVKDSGGTKIAGITDVGVFYLRTNPPTLLLAAGQSVISTQDAAWVAKNSAGTVVAAIYSTGGMRVKQSVFMPKGEPTIPSRPTASNPSPPYNSLEDAWTQAQGISDQVDYVSPVPICVPKILSTHYSSSNPDDVDLAFLDFRRPLDLTKTTWESLELVKGFWFHDCFGNLFYRLTEMDYWVYRTRDSFNFPIYCLVAAFDDGMADSFTWNPGTPLSEGAHVLTLTRDDDEYIWAPPYQMLVTTPPGQPGTYPGRSNDGVLAGKVVVYVFKVGFDRGTYDSAGTLVRTSPIPRGNCDVPAYIKGMLVPSNTPNLIRIELKIEDVYYQSNYRVMPLSNSSSDAFPSRSDFVSEMWDGKLYPSGNESNTPVYATGNVKITGTAYFKSTETELGRPALYYDTAQNAFSENWILP